MRRYTSVVCCAAVLVMPMMACSAPTSPSTNDIVAHRAQWDAHHLSDYSYTYQFAAFNAFAYQDIRVDVEQGQVRSAVVIATGQPVDAGLVPTIDQLFDQAIANAGHSLRSITFDPNLAYPARMSFSALPDALSMVEARALQPLQ